MNESKRDHALKMLELLNFEKNEHKIGAIIEKNGETQLVSIWDLEQEENDGKAYDFYNFFEKLGIGLFNSIETIIYVHASPSILPSYIFSLLNALISKNPRTIIYRKKLVIQTNEQIAEWFYIHERAQRRRKIELIEI